MPDLTGSPPSRETVVIEDRTLTANLASGGHIELKLHIDWSTLSVEDRSFVDSLLAGLERLPDHA